jgi:hypothetical protein
VEAISTRVAFVPAERQLVEAMLMDSNFENESRLVLAQNNHSEEVCASIYTYTVLVDIFVNKASHPEPLALPCTWQ